MHDDEANVANCKKVLHKNSLNFTKTPLKFSSISLIAEKKYGNYESGIYKNVYQWNDLLHRPIDYLPIDSLK